MRKMQKHTFEPVSLLTVENGVLEVAIIPAMNQPAWLVPKSLILSIESYSERIWTYLWKGREVSVYHLIPKGQDPDKLVILEGNTDVHRLALQTTGDVHYMSVRISDVKDVVLDPALREQMVANIPSLLGDDNNELDFMYEAVMVDGVTYIVPELDLIGHQLVDLDS